jgi:RPA43 OB domain in RNA Pol I
MSVRLRGNGMRGILSSLILLSDNEYVTSFERWTDCLGGIVTLSSPDHVALITHALFNISVPRVELPEEWRFEEDNWFDGDGKVIEGEVEFEVTQYDLSVSS